MLPPEYLRALLEDARLLGYSFESAWPLAVERAARNSDTPGQWLAVLADTRDAWERAYEGLPASPPEIALARAGEGLHRDLSLDARQCPWCGRLIPIDRDPRALFCDDVCKRRWNYERERARVKGLPPPLPGGAHVRRLVRERHRAATR
jgi:hypothetical protein